MKIKRKTPKPAAGSMVLYLVGYSFTPPSPAELKLWYDLEYGGPLSLTTDGEASRPMMAAHGPWKASLHLSVPPAAHAALPARPAWDHPHVGSVAPVHALPADRLDAVLLAARLARGFALMTQGTVLDLVTGEYLNPSDWQDRGLALFRTTDHVSVVHTDQSEEDTQWCHTLGLSKFGLDELETFYPAGLPSGTIVETLCDLADHVLRSGQNPKVGTAVDLPSQSRTVDIVRHRTAAPRGLQLIFRHARLS